MDIPVQKLNFLSQDTILNLEFYFLFYNYKDYWNCVQKKKCVKVDCIDINTPFSIKI